MGEDHLVLRYPWFAAANPKPNWTTATLPVAIKIQTAGAARVRSMLLLLAIPLIGQNGPSILITGTQSTQMQMEPLVEEGNEVYMRITKTMTAQQLTENAIDKTT